MIEINIDSTKVSAAMERLMRSGADMSPVMTRIAGVMHDAVMENFEQGGRPQWLGIQPGSQAGKTKTGGGDKILVRSGALRNSIAQESDATSATVGVAGHIKYAAIHQFGGKTRPHRIVAKNKKALAFGGVLARAVNHPGSNIPARPFLKLTEADEDKIVGKVNAYLRQVVGE